MDLPQGDFDPAETDDVAFLHNLNYTVDTLPEQQTLI